MASLVPGMRLIDVQDALVIPNKAICTPFIE
jgi:hypothetical protein